MHRNNHGFTLVELAIVMMIIGLLIGGVLKGQQMMQNARIKNVIKQVQSYNAASAGFWDKYNAIPGDMTMAQNRIPNCVIGNNCYNGNGNNIVGTPVSIWVGGQQAVTTENTQYWTHLLLSDFISGVTTSGFIAWGETHPSAATAGGYTVVHAIQSGSTTGFQASPDGLHLRLHGSLTSGNVENSGSGAVDHPGNMPVSPHEALIIDKTLDDAKPNSGYIRSYVYGNPTGPGCENEYDAQSNSRDCMMSFRLFGK